MDVAKQIADTKKPSIDRSFFIDVIMQYYGTFYRCFCQTLSKLSLLNLSLLFLSHPVYAGIITFNTEISEYATTIELIEEHSNVNKLVTEIITGPQSIKQKALQKLGKLASASNEKAALALGMVFWDGKYVERDTDKAYFWMLKAAFLGNSTAQFNVAAILSERMNQESKYGALCWLIKSIHSGYDGLSVFDNFSLNFELKEVALAERFALSEKTTCTEFMSGFDKK